MASSSLWRAACVAVCGLVGAGCSGSRDITGTERAARLPGTGTSLVATRDLEVLENRNPKLLYVDDVKDYRDPRYNTVRGVLTAGTKVTVVQVKDYWEQQSIYTLK